MLFAEIHHVSLNVSDVERALGFYRDLLGMQPLERPDFGFGGAWLDAGGGRQIHLIEADVPADQGQHVAFRVSSVHETIGVLEAAGVAVGDARPVGDTGMLQTFVHDPDGNRIEFTEIPHG